MNGRPVIDWDWIAGHLDDLWALTLEHVALTVIAVVVGFALSFGLSLLIVRWRGGYGPITAVAGIMYTIPSLALFAALVPITGLTVLSAEIALVSYTILILVRNIVTGIDGVPVDARDAADGMGFTRAGRLFRVDLPLALPVIVAGLRIATVTTIGLVTVSALIGQGGLGRLINEGLRTSFPTKTITGAVLSVLLAVVADVGFVLMLRALTPWSRARVEFRDVIEGLVSEVLDVLAWFGDPVNWTGRDGIPNRLTEHLVICILSMAAALAVSLPIGLYIGHTGRFAVLAVNLSNIGRAVPSYALMAVLYPLSIAFSIGVGGDLAFLATFAAMVLLAVPPVVTNTWTGIRGVDADLREAAQGMGMRGGQMLAGVEVPLALPVILAGVRIAAVQVVATATLGAVFGGGGLGRYIIQGFARRDDTRLWAGAVLVALLAIATELTFAWWIRRTGRRPGRTPEGTLVIADVADGPMPQSPESPA